MVQIIELRDVAVSQRTQAVNSVRGLCKAHGMFIPKCDASCFHKVARDAIPSGMAWKFKPMLRHLKELEANTPSRRLRRDIGVQSPNRKRSADRNEVARRLG